MSKSDSRRIIGPFNRVEGDLEVTVDIRDQRVFEARVNSPLFRGFEQILQGKDPLDALVYTPRICGICSVAQSMAAARALAATQGLYIAPNGRLASNITLACENLADHLSHFYLFFMPDFARSDYQDQAWFSETEQRFKAQSGSASPEMLKARAQFLHITGVLAGKWPHSLALQPGGTTRSVEARERIRLLAIVGAFRQFLETVLFSDSLDNITALTSADKLEAWADAHPTADFARFLHISRQLELHKYGPGPGRYMSYGAYEQESGFLFERGVRDNGSHALDPSKITEDISHSWMKGQASPQHPYDGGKEIPDDRIENGYSWCKAPRLDGKPVEVGAIARQFVHGNPLISDLVELNGANVRNRIIARMLELALVVPAMDDWIRQLKPREPFCTQFVTPDDAQGAGLIEAARGSLGHWVRIKQGKIHNYQIIAPTTWNFSPRDVNDVPGPLETALQGTPVGKDSGDHVLIQHIVRSFDPCMVCTVH